MLYKKEFVDIMRKKHNYTKKDTQEFVTNLIETLKDEISKGNSIQFEGLGTFKVNKLPAGKVRNPKTNEIIDSPERLQLKFVYSKKLKEDVKYNV